MSNIINLKTVLHKTSLINWREKNTPGEASTHGIRKYTAIIVKTVLLFGVGMLMEHHTELVLKIHCSCFWVLAKNLQCKLPKWCVIVCDVWYIFLDSLPYR